MAEPFLGEIRLMSFMFPPKGWLLCDGQFLPINQNQALFSLLGTTYGGDGRVTFALPDLRGRVPAHVGDRLLLGERIGEEAHTLRIDELPRHTHAATAVDGAGTQATPDNAAPARAADLYGPETDLVALQPGSVTATGGSQSHPNMQPYLTLSFCIAVQGIFPSQS